MAIIVPAATRGPELDQSTASAASGTYTQYCPRPACFPWYIARSARRTTRSGEESDCEKPTPTVAVTLTAMPVDLYRLLQGLDHPLRDASGLFLVGMHEEDGEFVTPNSADGVRLTLALTVPDRSRETTCDAPQHQVTDIMTERVVDRLEAVEIYEQNGISSRPGFHRDCLELAGKGAAVQQTGQNVVLCLKLELLLQLVTLTGLVECERIPRTSRWRRRSLASTSKYLCTPVAVRSRRSVKWVVPPSRPRRQAH